MERSSDASHSASAGSASASIANAFCWIVCAAIVDSWRPMSPVMKDVYWTISFSGDLPPTLARKEAESAGGAGGLPDWR